MLCLAGWLPLARAPPAHLIHSPSPYTHTTHSQVGGYTVLEVSVDLGTVTVTEGLTEDAVYARLHEGE